MARALFFALRSNFRRDAVPRERVATIIKRVQVIRTMDECCNQLQMPQMPHFMEQKIELCVLFRHMLGDTLRRQHSKANSVLKMQVLSSYVLGDLRRHVTTTTYTQRRKPGAQNNVHIMHPCPLKARSFFMFANAHRHGATTTHVTQAVPQHEHALSLYVLGD